MIGIMTEKIYIFDIDGCIMPSLFPNTFFNNLEEKEALVKKVNEEGWNVLPCNEFLQYFINIYEEAFKIFFLTGRQKENFYSLTIHQLRRIDYDDITFFQDGGISQDAYLKYKTNYFYKLFEEYGMDKEYFIFDDHNDYFQVVFFSAIIRDPDAKIHFYEINKATDWIDLNAKKE